MSWIFVLLAVMGFAVRSVSAHAVPQNCSSLYQAALQNVLGIKKECDNAVFYDCCEAMEATQLALIDTAEPPPSGIYPLVGPVCDEIPSTIGHHTQQARCDMDVDGGGWMVIQRRVSGGTENFDRTWKEYEDGFGNLGGEFWYGLRKIHCLTTQNDVELRIDTIGTDGTERWAVYQTFSVAGPEEKYQLNIGEGEGSDGYERLISFQNNQFFTTSDYDNDDWGGNCALSGGGGWWYHHCYYTHLNGELGTSHFRWHDGSSRPLASSEMKIRPKTCSLNKELILAA